MRVIIPNCPSCGGRYDGQLTSGILTCEYCGAKFALDRDEIESLGLDAAEDAGDAEQYEEEIQPMFDFAREACEDFVTAMGADEFKSSTKILDGLGIDDYEEVFIIHDDTIFKSGKNGFAITDYGLYCRELGDEATKYLCWGDFAECGKPHVDGSLVKADGKSIAYFTGNSDVRDELCSLYRKLRKHARKFDWVDVED